MSTSATAEPVADPRDPAFRMPLFARPRTFGLVLLVTGAVGWVASAILVLERLALYENPDHITSCDVNPWVSCGRVMGTWQSELFGFPNPLIGIVAFAIVVATATMLLSGASPGRWYWAGLQFGVTLGAVFVAWLWSQALFEIYILCLYCMVVWAAMIPCSSCSRSATSSTASFPHPGPWPGSLPSGRAPSSPSPTFWSQGRSSCDSCPPSPADLPPQKPGSSASFSTNPWRAKRCPSN